MKTIMTLSIALLLSAFLSISSSFADKKEMKKETTKEMTREKKHEMPMRKYSKSFKRMKSLVGTWDATSMMEGKLEKFQASYELTSGGSAILERIFVGTPKEMVSIYHDDGKTVGMTHYCMLGNHPKMTLTKSTNSRLKFKIDGTEGIQSEKEPHMHALTINFKNKNRVNHEWIYWEDGKKKDRTLIKLARRK